MTKTAKVQSPPALPDPGAPTRVRMTRWVRWGGEEERRMPPRDLVVGAVVEVPRRVAGRWWLVEYAVPEEGEPAFSAEELALYLRAALDDLEAERRSRGAALDAWEAIPVFRRRLERMKQLTRPLGPGGEAA